MPLPSSLRCFQILALAAALAAGGGAQAQSLLQLYDTAHGYDAAYQSALANAQASQARADQARAGLLPQIGLQAGAQHNWADVNVAGNSSSRSFNVLNGSIVGSHVMKTRLSSAQLKRIIGLLLWLIAVKMTFDLFK